LRPTVVSFKFTGYRRRILHQLPGIVCDPDHTDGKGCTGAPPLTAGNRPQARSGVNRRRASPFLAARVGCVLFNGRRTAAAASGDARHSGSTSLRSRSVCLRQATHVWHPVVPIRQWGARPRWAKFWRSGCWDCRGWRYQPSRRPPRRYSQAAWRLRSCPHSSVFRVPASGGAGRRTRISPAGSARTAGATARYPASPSPPLPQALCKRQSCARCNKQRRAKIVRIVLRLMNPPDDPCGLRIDSGRVLPESAQALFEKLNKHEHCLFVGYITLTSR